MNNLKHTKGPLMISESGNPNFDICLTAPDGGSICHFTKWTNSEYDVKLYSMAPEMLDLLLYQVNIFLREINYKPFGTVRNLIEHLENDVFPEQDKRHFEELKRMIDTIEKATGQKIEDII